MRKGLLILSSAVLTLGLAGCGGNDNAGGDNDVANQQRQTIPRTVNYEGNNGDNNNNNGTLSIAERAERQVEQLDEVEDANVIISNNNAYVAIRLADNNNNNAQGAGNGNNNGDNDGNAIVNDGLGGNGETLMDNGTVNQDDDNVDGDDGVIDGKGDAGNKNGQNTAAGNTRNNGNDDGNNNNLIGLGNGYENADNNNNNGNNDNGGNNNRGTTDYSPVSNSFEQRIADQVRQADSRIHKVYVSLDREFYDRMTNFADDIRNGNNGDNNNLFENFNRVVRDFFGANE